MVLERRKSYKKTTLFFFSLTAYIMCQDISGVVYDQNGSPLAGANVIIAGTNSGAATDVNGVFSFTLYVIPFLSTISLNLTVLSQLVINIVSIIKTINFFIIDFGVSKK